METNQDTLKEREIAAMRYSTLVAVGIMPLDDAANLCGIHKRTLLNACHENKIDYSKQGKYYYFTVGSLYDWMNGGRGISPSQQRKKI